MGGEAVHASDAPIRLYAFHCGGLHADISTYDPFDPKVGTQIYSPNFFYLIRHPEGNVVFDTGIRPDYLDQGDSVNSMEIEFDERHHTDALLATIGLTPSDITHVILSHLHWDHAGGLLYFPGAKTYVHRRELEFAFAPAVYQEVYYDKRDFDLPIDWIALEGDFDLFGDGRITVIPTPGHTPGHQALLVRLDGGAVFLLSDAVFEIDKMRKRVLFSIVWNPDLIVESWERIEQVEQEFSAQLIPAHELEFQTRVRVAPDAWYE
jgi:glyoxylase-like metal-dependent hydrolase (beta-lactamase superfamily II)